MSANTLTGLIPVIYKATNVVAREQTGFIAACYKDSSVGMASKDQTIRYPIVPTLAAENFSPTMTLPDPNGITIGYGDMTIDKVRDVAVPWTGEEEASLGSQYEDIVQQQIEQAVRVLVNEMESDLFLAAKRGASRAYGTAGSTPFGTAGDFSDFANVLKILIDNGAPQSDLHLVLNTTASTNIRSKQSSLFKVSEAGNDSLLRGGNLGQVERFYMHESGQIVTHTKGTGSAYVFNGTHAVNVTTITPKSGSNTLLYGDVLSFEDDANKYVANSTLSGTFTIGGPGLLQQQTDGKTITIGNNYLGSWAFDRNALHLMTRLPIMPSGGDAATDDLVLTDPYSGISFRFAIYRGKGMQVLMVSAAWGVKVVKSNYIATLLG